MGIDSRGKILTYINGKPIIHCRHVFITAPVDIEIDNMDDLIKYYKDNNLHRATKITPEQSLWVHASNLQAWVDHGYDMRVIDSNLGNVILGELIKYDLHALESLLVQTENYWKNGNFGTRKVLLHKLRKNFGIVILLAREKMIKIESVRKHIPYIDLMVKIFKDNAPKDIINLNNLQPRIIEVLTTSSSEEVNLIFELIKEEWDKSDYIKRNKLIFKKWWGIPDFYYGLLVYLVREGKIDIESVKPHIPYVNFLINLYKDSDLKDLIDIKRNLTERLFSEENELIPDLIKKEWDKCSHRERQKLIVGDHLNYSLLQRIPDFYYGLLVYSVREGKVDIESVRPYILCINFLINAYKNSDRKVFIDLKKNLTERLFSEESELILDLLKKEWDKCSYDERHKLIHDKKGIDFGIFVYSVRDGILDIESIKPHIPFIEFLIKRNQFTTKINFKYLNINRERSLFKKRLAYHEKKIYPNVVERRIARKVRNLFLPKNLNVKEKDKVETIKISIVGKVKSFNKELRKSLGLDNPQTFLPTMEEIGVNFFSKKFTILELNIRNQIWMVKVNKLFRFLTRSYIEGSFACIICTSNKKYTKYFINAVQKGHLNTDNVILIKEKNLSIDVFNFINATYAKGLFLLDEKELKVFREKLPRKMKILSEINKKSKENGV